MNGKVAVVIPTYNEKDNIRKLILAIFEYLPEVEIFVVDDNSPDGTAQIVQELASANPRVRLLFRESKEGLASAYLDAFARIIPDESYQYIATMDADLSHHPSDLVALLHHAQKHDVVIGSRYVRGGRIENWAWWRRFISFYGNIYTKFITRMPINDLTAGFVVYSRDILGRVLMRVVPREPYAFQTEMKYLAYEQGVKLKEVPITFRERVSGKSKLKQRAIFEALFFPWYLIFHR